MQVPLYIGLVEELCVEEGDLRVRFMHPKGPGRSENCFSWPPMVDICYIPEKDILCSISAPMPSSKSGRKYNLNSLDAKSTCTMFEKEAVSCRLYYLYYSIILSLNNYK